MNGVVAMLTECSKQGYYRRAHVAVAELYESGCGVEYDIATASDYYVKAVSEGCCVLGWRRGGGQPHSRLRSVLN